MAARGSRSFDDITRPSPGLNVTRRESTGANQVAIRCISSDAGSLEAGKSADVIVVDRDILPLVDSGQADDIAKTKVLTTYFRGKLVFAQP